MVAGVKIFRLPFIGDRAPSPVKRILSLLRFSLLSVQALYSQKLQPDLVRANQLGLPGYLVSHLKRIPLFLDVQDMWPEWAKTSNFNLSTLLYVILDFQQKMIYRRARKITTISKRFMRYLEAKGIPAKKIFVLSNWAGSDDFKVQPRDKKFGLEEGMDGKFNIMYAGNIGSAQGLDIVLQSAQELGDIEALQFVIIGDGLEKDELQARVRQMGLESVRFLGRKSPEALAQYLAWADVLLLPLRKNPIYEVTIPSKTFTYLACGRPILATACGDVADLISEIGAGVVVPPQDPHALALAIQDLMAMDPLQREQYGFNALAAHQNLFDRSELIRQYDQLLKASI